MAINKSQLKIPSSLLLVGAMMIANFINFLFNAFLGRQLTLEDYGALTLINTLWFLISVFINSLATTTNHFTAYNHERSGVEKIRLYRSISKIGIKSSLLAAGVWFALTPLLANFFNLTNTLALISITPIIAFGSMLAIGRGYFQGRMMFGTVAFLIITESISKLLYAILFVSLGLQLYVYLTIPLSVFTAFLLAYILSPKSKILNEKDNNNEYKFPTKFYGAAVINGLATASFLSIDLLLAKHFLNPTDAGIYSLLSLVGKMIYFLGTILNGFIVTYVSRDFGTKKDFKTTFYKFFLVICTIVIGSYIALGYFGNYIVPLLLGQKAVAILPFLKLYGLGIAIFTVTSTVISFHLSKRAYIFSYFGLVTPILMTMLVFFFHSSISEIIYSLIFASLLHFIGVMFLHMYFTHWKKAPVKEIKKPEILKALKTNLPISVSICLPAYNEEKNIGGLLDALLQQKTKNISINRIVVVSSASTDDTDYIAKEYIKKDRRISLIREKERTGKASAINLFLKDTDDPIVVVQSTDTIPDENTIENLCFPFLTDKKIGMTGGAPIPVNDSNTFIGFVVHTWWWFHRNIPRFGEIIAFRNILTNISPTTAVDEAYIQAKFVQMGYKVVHIDDAVVYNKGAETIKDMIKQRRRIHNGHSRLREEESVKVTNFTKNSLWLLLFRYELRSAKHVIWLFGGILIEVIGVLLAIWDKAVNKVNPTVWETAVTTKDLGVDIKRDTRDK